MEKRSSSALIVASTSVAFYLLATLIAFISFRLPLFVPFPFVAAAMSLPGTLIVFLITKSIGSDSIPAVIACSSLFWLLAGALIGRALKDRGRAIIAWLALAAIIDLAGLIGWSLLIALTPD